LHGSYRKLRSYKVAEAVYDATVPANAPAHCAEAAAGGTAFLGLLGLSRLQGDQAGEVGRV
jgi:hypothetical protein